MSTLIIVGMGTIGSSLVPLAARMPDVTRITLIDPDSYTEANLDNQAIDSSALGRPKVEVQAESIRTITPRIKVVALQARVENVPLAVMDSAAVLSCVDNRRARQTINRVSWRRGNPWVDAAVGAASQARTNVYVPGASAPCIECGWDQHSYELLEQEYPCKPGSNPVPATGTPAELGALAASLQAAELRRILDETEDASLAGSQFMLDTALHTGDLYRFAFNEQCRFDHEIWSVETIALAPRTSTLADLFDAVNAGSDSAISLEGHTFATYLDCIDCRGRSNIGLSLFSRLLPAERSCHCGGRMVAPGFFSFDAIRRSEVTQATLNLNLGAIGFLTGDVISVTNGAGATRHIEIAKERSSD